MTGDLPADLAAYLASVDRERAASINRVFDTLTPFEQQIVREVAGMAYVLGHSAGRNGTTPSRPARVVQETIDGCLTFPDLYPTVAAAAKGQREEQ